MVARTNIPKSLGKDPIVRALFEMRFKPRTPGLEELLPGYLHSSIKEFFPRSTRLPAQNIPIELRRQVSPNAIYEATRQLSGDGINLKIGAQSIVVENVSPYWGWARFRDVILLVLKSIFATGEIDAVERASLRYQNVIDTPNLSPTTLEGLDMDVRLAEYDLSKGFQFRTEFDAGGCLAIVHVTSNVTVAVKSPAASRNVSGVLLDIDTINQNVAGFPDSYEDIVEQIHNEEKSIFFSLIKDVALNELEPEW